MRRSDLDHVYETAEPVRFREDFDTKAIRLDSDAWPDVIRCDAFALGMVKPGLVEVDGLITMTLTDGTYANGGKASYRIVGFRDGNILCRREMPEVVPS